MGKTFYSEYADHMLRRYVRRGDELTEVDQLNVAAVEKALGAVSDFDKLLVLEVYGGVEVSQVAQLRKVDQSVVWMILSKVRRKVAIERRLI